MNVLFVCMGNMGRSQMAEAFFKKLSKHTYASAGTHVGEKEGQGLNDKVKGIMKELGYDLSKATRTQLTPELVEEFDKVIMITAKEDWPEYVKNNEKVTFWDIPDGSGTDLTFHRKIRDDIKKFVQNLVAEIG